MTTRDKLPIILFALLEMIKERGLEEAGSDVAFFCNQLLEEAIAQAEAYGIPLEEIGLANIDTNIMLFPKDLNNGSTP